MKMGILPVQPRRLCVYALAPCILSLSTSLGSIISKKEPNVYMEMTIIWRSEFYDIPYLNVF